MREGVSPSDAVNDILTNPANYPMECGQFVQVLKLYGMLNSMGDEGFNSYIKKQGGNFVLRNHSSTGLTNSNTYTNRNGSWFDEKGKFLKKFNIEKEVEKSPIGTRMTLKSTFLEGSVYYNENIVKVGDNEYMAQGLGEGTLTMDQVKQALIQKAVEYRLISKKQAKDPDGVSGNIAYEVKNYNLTSTSSRYNLYKVVSEQVNQRRANLPKGTTQHIIIDVRGQNVTPQLLRATRWKLLTLTGTSDIKVSFKNDIGFKTDEELMEKASKVATDQD